MMNAFWKDLLDREDEIRAEFAEMWEKAGAGPITQEDAVKTLQLLYDRSHLDIYLNMRPEYRKYFPTKQGNRNRLKKVQNLWWVDHATAGVNGYGTLGWFSSMPRTHAKKFSDKAKAQAYAKQRKGKVKEKKGKWVVTWTGLACAVTHFVVFTNGLPFMLLPLDDGCWGEPMRNGDGIHVEMVNPLICKLKNGQWNYWAGKIPQTMLDVQKPEQLEKPFRGATHMMPYTWEQVVTDIKLKRLCIAATQTYENGKWDMRMHPDRMSQHTDWRRSKYDMGPLWPFDLVNQAAFDTHPIEEYSFVQFFVRAPGMDDVADSDEVEMSYLHAAQDENVDHDLHDDDVTIDSVMDIQNVLIRIYGDEILPKYGADGDMGNETTGAVRWFQKDWNRNNREDQIKVDGIPGVRTQARMKKAVALGAKFQTTQP
jgi:hypothetical protein